MPCPTTEILNGGLPRLGFAAIPAVNSAHRIACDLGRFADAEARVKPKALELAAAATNPFHGTDRATMAGGCRLISPLGFTAGATPPIAAIDPEIHDSEHDDSA